MIEQNEFFKNNEGYFGVFSLNKRDGKIEFEFLKILLLYLKNNTILQKRILLNSINKKPQ